MRKIIFLILIGTSLLAFCDEISSIPNNILCSDVKKVELVAIENDKIKWEDQFSLGQYDNKKTTREQPVFILKLKNSSHSQLVTKENSAILGEQNMIITRQRNINNRMHNTKYAVLTQAVFFPTKIQCEESSEANAFIVSRYNEQKNKNEIYRKNKIKYNKIFNVKKEEIYLFEESGHSYYFYPPNYISKFKNLKGDKKKFEQSVYLFSMVIDNDLKLKYPMQKDLIEKFKLFEKNNLEIALGVERSSLFIYN